MDRENFQNPIPSVMMALGRIDSENVKVLAVKKSLMDRLAVADSIFNFRKSDINERFRTYRLESFPSMEKIFIDMSVFLDDKLNIKEDDCDSFIQVCRSCSRIVERFITCNEENETKIDITKRRCQAIKKMLKHTIRVLGLYKYQRRIYQLFAPDFTISLTETI